ncbi:WXG100 family type VII secretion target [Pseudonocardia sp. ICBG1122]|nr:WXG100 family type VII secretion target [Pseudonocardia pini]
MDVMSYQYEQIEEALAAMKRSAQTLQDETSQLRSAVQQLFGSDFKGDSANQYNTTANELQQQLQVKNQYIEDLHREVTDAIERMRASDRAGVKGF